MTYIGTHKVVKLTRILMESAYLPNFPVGVGGVWWACPHPSQGCAPHEESVCVIILFMHFTVHSEGVV